MKPTLQKLQQLFSGLSFHPVIRLPAEYEIFDFSQQNYDPNRYRSHEYGIGKYNERRMGMYTSELFTQNPEAMRDVHMGIDIAAPVDSPVYAFSEGKIFCAAVNPAEGDYGGTVITEHEQNGVRLWALHGHLSHASVKGKQAGTPFSKGDVIAWVGSREENGGWNPHLHFQLSLDEPIVCDMPGAVSVSNRDQGCLIYPDPRLVLGKLYE